MEANSVPSKKPEYGLIILGNAGAGKSYICNMIIGYERFETDFRWEAVTTTVEYHRIDGGPSDLLIYNIPGLIESHQEEIDRNKREIMKAFEQSPISVVMFVSTQVGGRPQPDDIIAFKALQEAYKFSSKSLMFVMNNIPSKRPPTYEGRFFALLTKMLNPMPISLEDIFFLDTLNSEDNEKFGATRDRLLHFIAQHHEKEQKMQADIIVQSNELWMLRKVLKEQCLEAEENIQALELQVKQIAEEYEAVRKGQEKRCQDMVFKLEIGKQQAAEVEIGKQQAAEVEIAHELAGVELETLHKEKKTGLKGRCQQLWKQVEDERGICKKVEKSCKIARDELLVKYQSNEDDGEKNFKTQSSAIENKNEDERNEKGHRNQLNKAQKKPSKLCNDHSDSNLLRPAAIGGGLGAASGCALGAGLGCAAGAVVGGGAAVVIIGPGAIATAAAGAGAAAGTAAGAVCGTDMGACSGVAVGGIGSAITTLYRRRRR